MHNPNERIRIGGSLYKEPQDNNTTFALCLRDRTDFNNGFPSLEEVGAQALKLNS